MKRDVAIVGAGYVGLPLARTFADAGKRVLLVDVDPVRVEQLNAGESYIEDVPTGVLTPLVDAGLVAATTDYDELRDADAILVALPTPFHASASPICESSCPPPSRSRRGCGPATSSYSSRRRTPGRHGSR